MAKFPDHFAHVAAGSQRVCQGRPVAHRGAEGVQPGCAGGLGSGALRRSGGPRGGGQSQGRACRWLCPFDRCAAVSAPLLLRLALSFCAICNKLSMYTICNALNACDGHSHLCKFEPTAAPATCSKSIPSAYCSMYAHPHMCIFNIHTICIFECVLSGNCSGTGGAGRQQGAAGRGQRAAGGHRQPVQLHDPRGAPSTCRLCAHICACPTYAAE